MPSTAQGMIPPAIRANEAQRERYPKFWSRRPNGRQGRAGGAPLCGLGALTALVRREVGPACAQRAAMLISGGDFCFAEPPGSGKRSTADRTELPFSSPTNASGPSQSATKRYEWQRIATKYFEMLGNVSECSGKNDLLPRPSCHGCLSPACW